MSVLMAYGFAADTHFDAAQAHDKDFIAEASTARPGLLVNPHHRSPLQCARCVREVVRSIAEWKYQTPSQASQRRQPNLDAVTPTSTAQ